MNDILTLFTNNCWWVWLLIILIIIAIRDVFIKNKHAVIHNFPIIGHFRYMLEKIGPELRQYLDAKNREELPFNKIERGWI